SCARRVQMKQAFLPAVFLLAVTAVVGRAAEVVPTGPEFRVSRIGDTYYNSYDGYATDPRAQSFSNDEFVVVWETDTYHYGEYSYTYGPGVTGRKFTPDGNGGLEFNVHFDKFKSEYGTFRPGMDVTTQDRFVVVWSKQEDPPSFDGKVSIRRFDQGTN